MNARATVIELVQSDPADILLGIRDMPKEALSHLESVLNG